MDKQKDVWLRGPIEGVDPLVQPAAHAFIQVLEDIEKLCEKIDPAALWTKPENAASPGFHLLHIAGATERLLTYARGEQLSDAQIAAAKAESQPPHLPASELLSRLRKTIGEAIEQIRTTPAAALIETRDVGRARVPSTVIGLIFHAAEHAARHSGQLATTLRLMQPHSIRE